jgi:cysteine desulfurase
MRPGVLEAMQPYMADLFGNPSGSHAVSRRAKNALEEARERAAAVLGANPREIVFTGGGTESDNLAVKGVALAGGRRGGVVTVATEHEAVLESAAFLARLGCPVSIVGVDRFGRVDPDQIAAAVTSNTAVVSVMTANNETGTMQPVCKVADAVRGNGVLVHTDAVQAFSSEDLDVDDLGVDLLSLAAHKFGGPEGAGLVYVRSGVAIEPVLHGGGQELGRRSGTHNVAAAVGTALAMELAAADRPRFRRQVAQERASFESRLDSVGARMVPVEDSIPQHSHMRFPGIRNETILIRLDQLGLAASVGSACQSGAATVSHVLTAMGMPAEEARHCLRFSFGWNNRDGDGEAAADMVLAALET